MNNKERTLIGIELEQGLIEALKIHDKNKGRYAKTHSVENTEVEPIEKISSVEIKELQEELEVSTAIFSELIGASVKTIQAWESGARTPNDYAYRLMTMYKKHPEYVEEILHCKKEIASSR